MGAVKAGSKASLIAGLAFGGLYGTRWAALALWGLAHLRQWLDLASLGLQQPLCYGGVWQ